jgi:hypothetical protein
MKRDYGRYRLSRQRQYRQQRAKRSDGLLTRKYTPEQWQQAIEIYQQDRTLTIAAVARIVGMSYKMTYKVIRGPFSFGRKGGRKYINGK